MAFFSAIIAVNLISRSFVLIPAVGGSMGSCFAQITPLFLRTLISLVTSLVASTSSSSLLSIESFGNCVRFGCHRSICLAFVECIHNLLNCNSWVRLKNHDCDYIGRRKSRIDVILEDYVGDCFFGAGELSGDVKQFDEVGIERPPRSGPKSAEFPKE